MRPIGASELIGPTIQTTLLPDAPRPERHRQVAVQVHNNGPAATIAAEGTLSRGTQTIPISFPAADARRTAQTGDRDRHRRRSPNPRCGRRGARTSTSWSSRSASESSYSARVGLRQLTWHGGRLYLNGRRLRLHGATIQEDARGHGDALTPADQDAIVSELKAIGANAVALPAPARPRAAGTSRRRRASSSGRGSDRWKGRATGTRDTPSLLAEAEQQVRSRRDRRPRCIPRSSRGTSSTRSPATAATRAEVSYVRELDALAARQRPHADGRGRRLGRRPATRAGALYSEVDAVAETDYTGWYDSPQDTPAAADRADARRLAAMEQDVAGKVLVISEFGAESNTLNRPGQPGGYGFQASLLASHIDVYAADPQPQRRCSIWVLRDYPLTPTFRAARSMRASRACV